MMIRSLFLITAVLIVSKLHAQEQERFLYGIQTQTTLSFTGWRQSLNFSFTAGKNQIYAGPGMSISDAYFPTQTSLGWQLGYSRIIEHDHQWFSTAGIRLQSLYGAKNTEVRPQTYEAFLNYGFGYRIGKLEIVNTMGFGGYLERFYNTGFREKQTIEGYNFILNLTIGYTF